MSHAPSKKTVFKALSFLIAATFLSVVAYSQSTEFTYQGQLQNSSAAANGNFDFEFVLFDSLTAGSQQGSTLSRNTVPVASGLFSVKLDFGNQFSGPVRYLEIRVRPSGQPGITILAPRQLLNSAPFAVKSLTADSAANATSAAQLGGVAASQYVLTGDARMTDSRNPMPNSVNYIQNTASLQSSSTFNISGNGTIGGNLVTNGNVSIGTTSANNKLTVNGRASFGGTASNTGSEPLEAQGPGAGISLHSRTEGAIARWVIYSDLIGTPQVRRLVFYNQFGGVVTGVDTGGNFFTNGCISASNISCGSDARLKKDVKSLNYGLNEVLGLHPVTWLWKDTTTTQPNIGFVAQEVAPLLPELILHHVDGSDSLGVNYVGLIPVIVKGIQQQQSQVEAQSAQLNKLKALNAKQASEIDALRALVCRNNKRAAVCKAKN